MLSRLGRMPSALVILLLFVAGCAEDNNSRIGLPQIGVADTEYIFRASGAFFSTAKFAVDGEVLEEVPSRETEGMEVRFKATDGREHALKLLAESDLPSASGSLEMALVSRYCDPMRYDEERQFYDVIEDASPVGIVIGCSECQKGDLVAQECLQYRGKPESRASSPTPSR